SAIDRMMPMIRFFRHGDGALAHFNGVSGSRSDLIALIFAYDDVRGSPVQNAVHSGYQRITAGETVVIVDSGAPPPPPLSQHAHAGCLSFEMSAGGNQIIVNCGAPPETMPKWKIVARATAAHSTAVLNDTSSCRFVTGRYALDRLGPVIISGPRHVTVDRDSGEDGETLWLSHDGYARLFGIIHERRLTVSPDGLSMSGEDRFTASHGGAVRHSRDRYAVRFHLHPSVTASPLETGALVQLVLGDGETWLFSAPESEIAIEESVYLSDIHGNRDTEQLVIYGRASQTPTVAWSLRRLDEADGR
ncbi:MAG: heparinase II/III family protein, partial [Hyphomicrobiales bacterium]|nr:heparinase II/III family protein [Hyphomicrobiales bacterium]